MRPPNVQASPPLVRTVALVIGLAAAAAPITAQANPRVFVVNEKPDDERGVLKLARYHGSTATAAGNAILVTTRYEPLCTLPCGVAVDAAERPIFFFIRDGNPVSYGFRLPQEGTLTLSFKPAKRGMVTTGVVLTSIMILPVGIPLWLAGRAKVSIADGRPGDTQAFRKLKRAKT